MAQKSVYSRASLSVCTFLRMYISWLYQSLFIHSLVAVLVECPCDVVFYRHPSSWAPFTSPLYPHFPPFALLSCPPALPLSHRYFPECRVANRPFSTTRCLHSQTCWLSHGLMDDLSVVSGLEWETVCCGLIRCLSDWLSHQWSQTPKTWTFQNISALFTVSLRNQIWWPKHFACDILRTSGSQSGVHRSPVGHFVDPDNKTTC